eukprot:9041725-Alexandrium_andersonii.AAC.1
MKIAINEPAYDVVILTSRVRGAKDGARLHTLDSVVPHFGGGAINNSGNDLSLAFLEVNGETKRTEHGAHKLEHRPKGDEEPVSYTHLRAHETSAHL